MAPPVTKFARTSANAIAFAELVLALSKGEHSREELLEIVGISDSSLRAWIKYLHARKLIYICERRRRFATGARQIIYAWNTEFKFKDVPAPEPMTQAEYSERCREKKRRLALMGVKGTDHGTQHNGGS